MHTGRAGIDGGHLWRLATMVTLSPFSQSFGGGFGLLQHEGNEKDSQ